MSLLDGPSADETDTRALLTGYLDWYRDALERKLGGLTDEQLRTPLAPPDWTPLGLVKHLTGVERRWLQWGFLAQDMVGFPDDEWSVDGSSTESVLAEWRAQQVRSREIVAAADLDAPAAIGGRFAADPPPLVRILFHLVQEYARHVGQLDIVRELIDGSTGE